MWALLLCAASTIAFYGAFMVLSTVVDPATSYPMTAGFLLLTSILLAVLGERRARLLGIASVVAVAWTLWALFVEVPDAVRQQGRAVNGMFVIVTASPLVVVTASVIAIRFLRGRFGGA
jgi:uncharacterized membrane protein YpjA